MRTRPQSAQSYTIGTAVGSIDESGGGIAVRCRGGAMFEADAAILTMRSMPARTWARSRRRWPAGWKPRGRSCPLDLAATPSPRHRRVKQSLRGAVVTPLCCSIITVLDVTVMVTVCRPWWRCRCAGSARQGAQAPADRRADAGAVAPAGNRADYSPGTRPEQSAAEGAFTRIVRVCRGCRCR